jgi:hypothetical protein
MFSPQTFRKATCNIQICACRGEPRHFACGFLPKPFLIFPTPHIPSVAPAFMYMRR